MTVQAPERNAYYDHVAVEMWRARMAKGWTPLRLAVELGVSAAAISRWEGGQRTPSAYHIDQMERLLNWRLRP